MAVAHLAVHRGDIEVVLPGFDLQETLQAIQDYKIGPAALVGKSRTIVNFSARVLKLEPT